MWPLPGTSCTGGSSDESMHFLRDRTEKICSFLQAAIRAAKEEGPRGTGAQGGDDEETAEGYTRMSRVPTFLRHRLIPFLRQTIGRLSLLKWRWPWRGPRRKRGTHFGRMKTTLCLRSPLSYSCSFPILGGLQQWQSPFVLQNSRTPCGT